MDRPAAPRPDLARCAVAEAVGTGLLVATVVGSGILAQELSPDQKGFQLLANSTATVLGLLALILTFGPVSGAHFNPIVTLSERFLGRFDTRRAAVYMAAQVGGGCAGTIVANLMFDLPAVQWSATSRSGGGLWLGEVVATFGLLSVIFGVVRSGRLGALPVAVAGYIGAAYWFTSSTSFANPAVTVARTLTDTFAGIHPASVPVFVLAQLTGGMIAVILALFLDPSLPEYADQIVVPHDTE